MKEEVEKLKANMFSDDWETVKFSAEKLGNIGTKDVTEFLISLLGSESPGVRNRAALALESINDNYALRPLLTAIFKKENHSYNGTLVFVLQSLECSKNLIDIFKIMFYESYESKISAYAILCDQTFDFTRHDLIDIQQMWNNCRLDPDKCPGYNDEETKAMMQDAVDSYLTYLNDNVDY